MRVPQEKVEHFICFITSQHVISDLPFGEKKLTLSSKEIITVPNVIRMIVPERIVKQYLQTSLQGLDYITESGSKAVGFDDLEDVVDKLGDLRQDMSWAKQTKHQLKLAKRYLKGDFKVHISCSSTVPDHCRTHALSDPKDTDFHGVCDHALDGLCDRCDHLALTLNKTDKALDSVTGTPEETDELLFNIKHAKQNIDAWKAHLLRSLNQDDAKLDILEDLDKNSVLLVQDWAMKYLPRKYRESQRDWFAKRGLPWQTRPSR
ncbi:hypothetical protein QZH41_003861 [Actinostola sp. cb2023]|nr:hypothetical protein QZH41_000589 [Actinostola sp. cb2023]KAK3739649.1 hypothetical protein QZH41_003861 [Actinostola sp. cb2023]